MKTIHKVVRLEVFDFDSHPMAYAVASGKNKLGYTFKNVYYFGNKKMYESPVYDNVEDEAFYWLSFGINRDQENSLEKRINKILENNMNSSFNEEESLFKAQFDDGSEVVYHGKNKEYLKQMIFGYKN